MAGSDFYNVTFDSLQVRKATLTQLGCRVTVFVAWQRLTLKTFGAVND